jgi:hypothetical protein
MENNLTCTSREAAIAALETIAGILPGGTHRDTLIAVKTWIEEETRPALSAEKSEELQKIVEETFKKSEGEQKGWEWYERGSEVVNGKLVPTEPEDGAELDCRYNAQTKRWEPASTPPIIQKKTDHGNVDEG